MKTMKAKPSVKTVRYKRSYPIKLILPKTSREKAIKLKVEKEEKYSQEDTIINDSDEPTAEIVPNMSSYHQAEFFTHFTPPLTNECFISKSEEIEDSGTYFSCRECLQALIGANKYNKQYGSYIKIEPPAEIDKRFILFNVLSEKRSESLQILKCLNCFQMIGIETNLVKYLIKNSILIKHTKEINIGLFGLKNTMLNEVSQHISSLSDNDPSIRINCFQQSKETLFNLNSSQCQAYKEMNAVFIVHKIEGRVLLLGENGFYTLLIQEMRKYVHKHIYFILIFKDYSMFEEEEFIKTSSNFMSNRGISKKIIDDLVYKGKQEELMEYHTSSRIIILNETDMGKELEKYRAILLKDLKNKFVVLPKDKGIMELFNTKNETNEEEISNKMLEDIKKEEKFILFGETCFIL